MLTDDVLSVVCDVRKSVLPPRPPSPTEAVTSRPAWNELSIEVVVPVVLWSVYATDVLMLPPLVPGGAYSTVRSLYFGIIWPVALTSNVTSERDARGPAVAETMIVATVGVTFGAAVRVSVTSP